MGILDDLLKYALMPGQTSASENGRGFQIQRPAGETILLFKSDCADLARLHFTGKKCDVILYYKNESGQEKCCLIEFKGSSIMDAYEQIEETYKVLRSARALQHCEFSGLIITNGGSHINTKAAQAKYRLVKTQHRTVTGRKNLDIGPIIR